MENRKRKFSLARRTILGLMLVAAVSGVVAFVTFTQYFPSVPTGTLAANLVANCGASTSTALIVTPATVVAASPFDLVYSCSSGTAAISVTNGPITKIPT